MDIRRARIRAAERLLAELESELRMLPIIDRTLDTHLRALGLRRELRSWCEHTPREKIDAALDETRRLLGDTRRFLRELGARVHCANLSRAG